MQITEKQKQELIDLNDSRVNEILGINEFESGKWYKATDSKFMVLLTKYEAKHNSYGYYFDANGVWKGYGDLGLSDCILATNKEVEQRLIEEAKRRGYKNGNYECLTGVRTYGVNEDKFFYQNYKLWHGENGDFCNRIFEEGAWAEIKNPIKQKIEKLKQEIKELEKLCK